MKRVLTGLGLFMVLGVAGLVIALTIAQPKSQISLKVPQGWTVLYQDRGTNFYKIAIVPPATSTPAEEAPVLQRLATETGRLIDFSLCTLPPPLVAHQLGIGDNSFYACYEFWVAPEVE